MVYHVTNYMRETNVWMIRKMRWILWSVFGFVPLYRLVYWDQLGKRAALRETRNTMTEEERRAQAESLRADWGYHPRFEPHLDFSIKTRKYALQTPEEAIDDIPRVVMKDKKENQQGLMTHSQVNSLIMVAREHNRRPGVFDYNFPQQFYSTFPDIEQECVIEIGSPYRKRVHTYPTASNNY